MTDVIGWVFLAAVLLAGAWLFARAWYIKRMAEVFELGVKMGRGVAQIGQDRMDQICRDAGIDPTVLPGRAA